MNADFKRMLRRQRYLYERDSAIGVLHYSSENELYKMSPSGIFDYEKERQETEYRTILRKAMYLGLSDLRDRDSHWYELVVEYYLTEPRPTLEQLGERYGVTRQAVTKSLHKAMPLLRIYADLHLKRLLNE